MRSNLPLPFFFCLVVVAKFNSIFGFSSSIKYCQTNKSLKVLTQLNTPALYVATVDGSVVLLESGCEREAMKSTALQVENTNHDRMSHVLTKCFGISIGRRIGILLKKNILEKSLSYTTISKDWTPTDASKKMISVFGLAMGATVSFLAALKMNAIGSSLRCLSSISQWYMTKLEIAPLLTKCVTGGMISFAGDLGAQYVERKSLRSKHVRALPETTSQWVASSPRAGSTTDTNLQQQRHGIISSAPAAYNFRRGMARFLESLLVSSPLMHYGYDLFERIVPVVGGSGLYSSLAALMHVVADSVFLDGIFVGTGIVATSILEGYSLRKHVLPNLRSVYVPTLKASVVTSSALMPLQFLSFRFLPVQLRVLSVNAVDLIWTGVISFVSHSADVESGAA